MRRLLLGAILGVSLATLAGCEGTKAKPGVPENVDMNKAYPPAAALPDPKEFFKQSQDAAKAAPKTEVPGG